MSDEKTQTAQDTTQADAGRKAADDGEAQDTGADTRASDTKKAEATSSAKGKETQMPEKYDLKLPKGSLLDSSAIERISAHAKAKGLSNEAAQELMDREEQAIVSYHEGQMKQVEEIRTGWLKAAETDKEIGGDKFKENAELAKRVVERFGTAEFKKAMNETGFGNHPEVIRIFVRIGKMMADDQLVHPKSQTGGSRPVEEVFYGSPTT